MIYQIKKGEFFILTFIFIFGIFIAFDRGSNFSDGDAYSVILAFINYFNEGIYTPSRGAYGHPIPELLIGFFSYYFGTPISNIFCFILFFFSIIFLYKAFLSSQKNIVLFVVLIFSNFYLFFENTNSIDYPIAIFFFSMAIFLLKRENYILSFILFGLTIASRANFLTFIYPLLFIFFYNEIKKGSLINILKSYIIVTFVGLIFYIPLFDLHNYSLRFLDLPFLTEKDGTNGWYGGPKLTLESLVPRFIYKIYLLTGIYSSLFIFLILFFTIKKISFFNRDNQILIYVIFINLFVFFFMPTKILIINPFIIFLYILLFKYLNKRKIIILIFLNFFQWIISYQLVDIKYKEKDICFAKEAVGYSLNLSIEKGDIFQYFLNTKDMSKCYSKFMGRYNKNFEENRPLKLSDNTVR